MIDSLWDFQRALHNLLLNQESLINLITGIYYKVPQDTKFPYVQISFDNIKNKSITNQSRIQFEIIVNIFSRDPGVGKILRTAKIIDDSLTHMKFKNDASELIMLNFHKANFLQQNDGITQNLKLIFQAIVKKISE